MRWKIESIIKLNIVISLVKHIFTLKAL